MTKQEFMKTFDAIRNQRTYTVGELERIYHHAKVLKATSFKNIINRFLDAGGKPNVADFKNAVRALNYSAASHTKQESEEKTDCTQCQDSGLVELEVDTVKVLAQCFCALKFLSGIDLPTYPSPKTNKGKYLGPGRVPFEPGVDSAVESMEHYKQQLRISEQFWKGNEDE